MHFAGVAFLNFGPDLEGCIMKAATETLIPVLERFRQHYGASPRELILLEGMIKIGLGKSPETQKWISEDCTVIHLRLFAELGGTGRDRPELQSGINRLIAEVLGADQSFSVQLGEPTVKWQIPDPEGFFPDNWIGLSNDHVRAQSTIA
ncbi:MAG TPA: hypothetical protein VG984_02185 [Candidatus Paceibacterota bacterium]|nr:hypothetical protein [Candidatus Paceibacterota bacterium]